MVSSRQTQVPISPQLPVLSRDCLDADDSRTKTRKQLRFADSSATSGRSSASEDDDVHSDDDEDEFSWLNYFKFYWNGGSNARVVKRSKRVLSKHYLSSDWNRTLRVQQMSECLVSLDDVGACSICSSLLAATKQPCNAFISQHTFCDLTSNQSAQSDFPSMFLARVQVLLSPSQVDAAKRRSVQSSRKAESDSSLDLPECDHDCDVSDVTTIVRLFVLPDRHASCFQVFHSPTR